MERAHAHVGERGGDVAARRELARVGRREEARLRPAVVERDAPGERREQDDAERPQVERRLGGRALELLRRHVPRRADDAPRLRDGRAIEELRDAEVDDLHVVEAAARLLEEDVVGLDVAVHDAVRVRLAEARERLLEDARDARVRELDAAPELDREIAPGEQLHHEIERARRRDRGLAEVEDADHVGVVEPARRARLDEEPRGDPRRVEQVRVHELDGDVAVERALVGLVDDAHAAGADALDDLEAALDDAAHERVGVVDLTRLGGAARRAKAADVEVVAAALASVPHRALYRTYISAPALQAGPGW